MLHRGARVWAWALLPLIGCTPATSDHDDWPSAPDRARPAAEAGPGSAPPVIVPDQGRPGCAVVHVTPEESASYKSDSVHTADGPPSVVYLNRHGATYRPGANNSATNHSAIIGSARTIPAYARGEGSWQALVDCVAAQFDRFNVLVTDVEPSAGAYVEVAVGGWPSNLGLSGGITGIAPLDTYSCTPIERAVAYVFERNIGSDRGVCETVAHEIGHTISLEHAYLCEDPMTYLHGCGAKSFQDTEAWCGTWSSVRCDCRGGKQNTVEALDDLIGPNTGAEPPDRGADTGPPQVSLRSPATGATMLEHSTIEVVAEATDDQWLSRVELVWDYNQQRYGCPSSSQWVECTRDGDSFTWKVKISTGDRTFRVEARDFLGQTAVTEDRTIHLSADGTPPPELSDHTAPTISIASPQDGERRLTRSVVEVIADVADDLEVAQVYLHWAFNDETYPCPGERAYVSCTVDQGRYRFEIEVGIEAARPFTIRAVDTAGNTTESPLRTIHVAPDAIAPTVSILEPADGATLGADTEIAVTAQALDDHGVASATLEWDYNQQRYPCPHRSQWVDCDVDGDRFLWRVRVGTGSRVFRVQVQDDAGNNAVSEDRAFDLQ